MLYTLLQADNSLQQIYKIHQTLYSEDFTYQAFFSCQSSKLIIKDWDIYKE